MEVLAARKRVALGIGIGLLWACLLALLRPTTAFEVPELALVDARTKAFVGTREADPRIVLSVVDDQDIAAMAATGQGSDVWPWPKEIQAFYLVALNEAGARGLLCDILYFDRGKDPKLYPPDADNEAAVNSAHGYFYNAEEMATAMAEFGPVAIGCELNSQPVWDHPARVEKAESLWLPLGAGPGRGLEADREGVDLPVRAMMEGSRYLGFVNVHRESDGILRSLFPAAHAGERAVPSLALVGAALLAGEPVEVTPDAVRIGDTEQPLDEQGRFLVNFRGPAYKTYESVSTFDLVTIGMKIVEGADLDAVDREVLARVKGAVVVWGQSYAGDTDVQATPLHTEFLGPEFHAAAIDNLVHGDGRVRASRLANILVMALLCAGVGLLGVLRSRWIPHLGTLGALVLLFGAAWWRFRGGKVFDVFTPAVAIFLTAFSAAVFRLLTEGKRNKWLEQTFSRYLAPDVIEALKADPARLELGGRRRELTIFFSDVAAFTSISERLEPEQVVALLNRYLTGQSEKVMEEQGVIDKFEGDAIMAFFGDPLDAPDHALNGCRAALRCLAALPQLEAFWKTLGLESFDIRIGLNSGPALVGNMGSERRFDYTCMGDAVNLASRLEGANKAFGSRILIGPATFEGAKEHILAKPLTDLVVVGKSEAVAVYELVSLREDATEAQIAHCAAWQEAVDALRADDLAAAGAALDRAEQAWPGQATVGWLRGLQASLEEGERPRPWDGRWVLGSK